MAALSLFDDLGSSDDDASNLPALVDDHDAPEDLAPEAPEDDAADPDAAGVELAACPDRVSRRLRRRVGVDHPCPRSAALAAAEEALERLADEIADAIAAGRPVPPILAQIGTGVGKTSTIVPKLAARGVPVFALVDGHEARTGLADHVGAAAGPVHAEHSGRRAARVIDGELEAADAPGVCARMQIIVAVTGARHVPMTIACLGCPEGLADSVALHRGGASERLARAAWAIGVPPNAIKRCGFLAEKQATEQALVVIADWRSYSASWLPHKDGKRVVVVDEGIDFLATGLLTVDAMKGWRNAILERVVDVMEEDPAEAAALRRVDAAMEDTAHELGQPSASSTEPSSAMRAALDALEAATSSFLAVAMKASVPTLWWEEASVDWVGGRHKLPLRALADLIWAHRHDALQMEGAALRFAAPTALLHDLLAARAQFVFLDATPPRALCELIVSLGGTIVRAVPPQPVKIRWSTGRVYGRGGGVVATERVARFLADQAIADPALAIITHQPIARRAAALAGVPVPQGRIGWYGRDETAHDRWEGCDLLIAGIHQLTPPEERWDYVRDRALASLGGAPEWPQWTDERAETGEVEIVPGVSAVSPLHSAADPFIRDWQQERRAATIAQSVGRVRALRNPGHTVTILAPPVPLAEYGYLDVSILGRDPAGGGTRNDARRGEHDAAMARCTTGAIRLGEAGRSISRDAIRAELRRTGDPAPSSATYRKWLAEVGKRPPAELRAARARSHGALTAAAERAPLAVARVVAQAHHAAHGRCDCPAVSAVTQAHRAAHGDGCGCRAAVALERVRLLPRPPAPAPAHPTPVALPAPTRRRATPPRSGP